MMRSDLLEIKRGFKLMLLLIFAGAAFGFGFPPLLFKLTGVKTQQLDEVARWFSTGETF